MKHLSRLVILVLSWSWCFSFENNILHLVNFLILGLVVLDLNPVTCLNWWFIVAKNETLMWCLIIYEFHVPILVDWLLFLELIVPICFTIVLSSTLRSVVICLIQLRNMWQIYHTIIFISTRTSDLCLCFCTARDMTCYKINNLSDYLLSGEGVIMKILFKH